jgi:hypothetical protein
MAIPWAYNAVRSRARLLISLLTILSTRPSCALEIEFDYLDSFETHWPQAVAGLERAARNWEANLADPVLVQVQIVSEPLDASYDAFAFSNAALEPASYAEIRAALVADVTSEDDEVAVAHLPPGPHLTFRTHTPQGAATISTGTEPIHEALAPPRALSKALDLPISDPSESADGKITWNEFTFDPNYFAPYDYDPTDGVVGIDFVGIAMHELGHVLGFYSGVEDVDLTTLPDGPLAPLDINRYAVLRPLDLYRYSAASLPHVDIAPGGAPYFSIDGGDTRLASFHTGESNGDGLGAEHWIGPVGVMSGTGSSFDEVDPITALDLRAFDVIGWDLRPIPEPTTSILLLAAQVVICQVRAATIRGARPKTCLFLNES